MFDPDWLPGFQIYEEAPLAERVLLPPAQMTGGLALLLSTGAGITTTPTVACPLHPDALVPTTVYTVVPEGETTRGLAELPPGDHI